MPYSVRWPNDDIQVVIGSITDDARERKHNWLEGRAVAKHTPMLRAVLVDCINRDANSNRIKGIRVGRIGFGDGSSYRERERRKFDHEKRIWVTLAMPKACERDNPAIERMLKWTLHSCILWAAVAASFDNVDKATMGEVAAHLHQFEVAGYKAAKQCRMVLHSAMITEILPWKVRKPRRVEFKTSNWVPKVEFILDPEQISMYSDPFDRIKIDEILDVAENRVVIKFEFTGSTADFIHAIVIATVDELDAILISANLDLANEPSTV